MAQSRCDEIREQGIAERYAAGTLPEAEAAAFEQHYLTCARCQADVRLAAAIRNAPAGSRRRISMLPVGLALAVAAGLMAVVLLGPWRRAADLVRLGGIAEAPVYLGVQVRGAQSPADSLFDRAMAHYELRQYEAAAAGLRSALAAGVDAAPALFFQAASLLALGRDEDAARGFSSVIASGDTPYLPEARYYLAKALLRLGRGREAMTQLRQVAGGSAVGPRASALADSVERLAR